MKRFRVGWQTSDYRDVCYVMESLGDGRSQYAGGVKECAEGWRATVTERLGGGEVGIYYHAEDAITDLLVELETRHETKQ